MRGALVGWWELGSACSGEKAGGPNKMGGGGGEEESQVRLGDTREGAGQV